MSATGIDGLGYGADFSLCLGGADSESTWVGALVCCSCGGRDLPGFGRGWGVAG